MNAAIIVYMTLNIFNLHDLLINYYSFYFSIKSPVTSPSEVVFWSSLGNSFHNKHDRGKIRHQGGSGSADIFHCLDCRHIWYLQWYLEPVWLLRQKLEAPHPPPTPQWRSTVRCEWVPDPTSDLFLCQDLQSLGGRRSPLSLPLIN